MLVRSEKFRASKITEERVKNTPNIEILMSTEIDEVLGDGQIENGVRIINTKYGEKKELAVTGDFVAIGHKPNTDNLAGKLTMDKTGYLITEGKTSKTNVPG